MNYQESIEALEKVNEEYIRLKEYESPEYVMGRRIKHFKESFPHTLRWILNYHRNQQLKKKNSLISEYVSSDDLIYAKPPIETGYRGVVYSCVTNGYDSPYEPIYKSENLDYILFTDIKENKQKESYWRYSEIKESNVKSNGNLTNRYYKFHPFELFQNQYDFSIYIDGNVQTVSEISSLYAIARASKVGIAMHKHATRECAYLDAQWCLYNHRGITEKVRDQVDYYRTEGFPERFGLYEGTIIVVDLNNKVAKKIMMLWWEEFCRSCSRRDQLSFPYVLWKNGYQINDVGCLGNDEYHNPKFRINEHKGKLV